MVKIKIWKEALEKNFSSNFTYFDERRPILLYLRPAKKAINWIVFPRPISSPTIPPAC